MACPAILTGGKFLASTLGHLDCQAQVIGSYGYGALADPGSTVSLALLGLLTIFIALFGIRLLLGAPIAGRDVIGDVIKIGLVLTLATSWPAWRIVGYDLVLNAPGEIAQTIGASSSLPGSNGTLRARLQNADDGLVAMTMFGTGRLTGGVVAGTDLGDSFHGIALADETGFGWGRVLFLAGTIGPYAIVRLGAGILLGIAPLMAGLLLFAGTAGPFFGWLRGLAFCALGSVALSLIQGTQLAILDPWITDVLAQRGGGTFTPSAPTELIVLALAFVTLSFGALFLAARITFMPHLLPPGLISKTPESWTPAFRDHQAAPANAQAALPPPSRAHAIAEAVATSMRREESVGAGKRLIGIERADAAQAKADAQAPSNEVLGASLLGSSFRRTHRRMSLAGTRRDLQV